MKTLKNLFLIGGLAGNLVFSGCGNKSELEKFNQRNREVYEDFKEFCNENPNKKENAKSHYIIDFPDYEYSIYFIEKGYLLNINVKGRGSFLDYYGDGLDDKFADLYTFKNKNTSLIESEKIKDMPLEKQLSVAKKYTEILKEIMHEGKYKDY